jgi:hypothetical protein
MASGGYWQALLARALTDRIGPRETAQAGRAAYCPNIRGGHAALFGTPKPRRASDGVAISCEVEGKN